MFKKINISSKEKKLIICVVLAMVTLAVYWQVNQFDFVNIDDGVYVTENSHLQSGLTLKGLRWAFTTTYAEFWHPLTWLSLMLDHQLFSLNAGGYHMTNLVLHILSTLLLFWLFNRMTGALWKSAFVAAFFALHPLHVESVAWVAERKDVLSAFFWMLTLCLYVYYVEKPAIKRYLLVLCGFVLALMSKPMVVTLPVIMVLLDYWPLKRFESKKGDLILWQLKEKTPFFILSAVFSIITIYARYKPYGENLQSPLSSRLANALVSFVTYLAKTFWPADMAVFYPFTAQIQDWKIFGAFLLILVISVAIIVMWRRLPYLFVGWLWYIITIAPVIGIIKVGDFSMADRYHYLPSIGMAIMIAWGIPALLQMTGRIKKLLFPAATSFLIILMILTWHQCGYWQNSIFLFRHALQVTKDNYLAHNNLGLSLFTEGKMDESIEHYNKSIHIKPDYIFAYNNRGIIYAKLGRYQPAIDDFNEAIRRMPFYANAYNNRGLSYANLGQHQRAIEDYSEAIRFKPDYAEAYMNRGVIYLKQGNNTLGCPDAQKACALGNCITLNSAQRIGLCR
ncbi:MAG: tetratricopeptide repeat protein [Deltaproteobacteria bacterium]|nr:tetratricopeptide repeat protein [Deltaproteobacteria bacterium]